MSDKFTAIIVDDESSARDYLYEIIKMNDLPIEVIEKCCDLPEAIKSIRIHDPQIVFLDIEMPKYNGLQLMDFKEENWDFHLIFTTAYSQYAIDALRINADDYLLKPIQPEDLEASLSRISKRKPRKKKLTKSHISINSHKTQRQIDVKTVMYLEASGMYTNVALDSNDKILASKPLKYFEEVLPEYFVRIHRSYVVNTKFVKSISNIKDNVVTLMDDTELAIARKNRPILKEKMDE